MRYAIVPDIREFPSHRCQSSRIVYVELCWRCDVVSRCLVVSLRRLAEEVGLSYAAVRHALDVLTADGLVEVRVATQEEARSVTRAAAQRATHVRVLSHNELDGVNSARNDATSSAESDAERDAHNLLNDYNINNLNSHPRARGVGVDLVESVELEDIATYCVCDAELAAAIRGQFRAAMSVKGKSWNDAQDMRQHLLDWGQKHKNAIAHILKSKVDAAAPSATTTQEPQHDIVSDYPWPSLCGKLDWINLLRMVASGAAPAVMEFYATCCAELGDGINAWQGAPLSELERELRKLK